MNLRVTKEKNMVYCLRKECSRMNKRMNKLLFRVQGRCALLLLCVFVCPALLSAVTYVIDGTLSPPRYLNLRSLFTNVTLFTSGDVIEM